MIAAAPYGAVGGAETLFVQPAQRYDSRPPGLVGFVPGDAAQGREFLAVCARPPVACPAEAVMLYRDAIVLEGSYVLGRDGVAVRESYYNVRPGPALEARQAGQTARIAAGDFATLSAGAPVVALFLQDCNNFGHVLAEHLPRLLHLAAVGVRAFRLLVPEAARPFLAMVDFTLRALEMRAEFVICPAGSILAVPALHWVSLVGQGYFKSPTVLRLFERLRAASGTGHVERLYVARPGAGRRVVANAAALEAIAREAGYAVVEPSALPFSEQIALFAGARDVVGPMGAALTLAGAMAPGGRVGMIGPGYCDYFYWDLACLAGLGFDWGFTAPVVPFTMELLEAGMTIPPWMLRRLLAWGRQEGRSAFSGEKGIVGLT